MRRVVDDGVINFGRGEPSNDMGAAREVIAASTTRAFDLAAVDPLSHYRLFNYDEHNSPPFRAELAKYLSKRNEECAPPWDGCDMSVSPDRLFITSGISGGISLVCTHFACGRPVVVEDPTYFLAGGIFKTDHRLELLPIPICEDGMNLDALEMLLTKRQIEGKPLPSLLYTIPDFQNPTGVTMPAYERKRLVAIARTHGVKILADEVYHHLYFPEVSSAAREGDRCPPLVCYDEKGDTVFSLGSFSKTLTPGLRLGWIQAGKALMNTLCENGVFLSGGGVAPLQCGLMHQALKEGLYHANLEAIQKELSSRARTLHSLMVKHRIVAEPPGSTAARAETQAEDRPPYFTYCHRSASPPRGGYFSWIVLHPTYVGAGLCVKSIAAACKERKVVLKEGSRCSELDADEAKRALRMCWAWLNTEEMEEGVRVLQSVLDELSGVP